MVSSLFENLLNAGQRKLLVVGYGFRDKHINEIIANALKHHQLQLYIMSPKQPIDFRSELFSILNRPYNIEEIWNSISGYFPGKLHDFHELGHDNVPAQAKSFDRIGTRLNQVGPLSYAMLYRRTAVKI